MAEPDVEVKDAAPAKKRIGKSTIVKILLGFAIVVGLFAMVFYTTVALTKTMRSSEVNVEPGVSQERSRSFSEPPVVVPMGQFTSIITDASGR
ncbi:MAG: hypothetical protein AAB229_09320, partial [Candidatus Hydrogenedentota bacterium]